MLYEEFLRLTGFTKSAISQEQYSKIEAAYMKSTETKQEFCRRFYEAYKNTVCAAIDTVINQTSIAENNNELQQRLDEMHSTKLNQLIELIA